LGVPICRSSPFKRRMGQQEWLRGWVQKASAAFSLPSKARELLWERSTVKDATLCCACSDAAYICVKWYATGEPVLGMQ